MTGRRVEKPWGHELIWAETPRYVAKILRIERGKQLSRQYHRVKDETLYVYSGTMELEIGQGASVEVLRLGPGESYRVLPGTIHRMRAVETVDVFEVSTPELDDVVRLEDDYGREGTSAP